MRNYKSLLIGAAALVFAIVSARLNNHYLAYGVVVCILLATILCLLKRLNPKAYPYLVLMLGLSLLWQSTLISNNLIGTDINTEYYFYLNALRGWNIYIPHAYNTAIGTTVLAPLLTNLFKIPGYFIYKVIFPFLFSFVPLILYYIYKKQFGDKVSFLACMVFITLPTYTLELIGLPRQMLGELALALTMLLVINIPGKLKWIVLLLIVSATLCYLFHYVIGFIVFGFLLCSLIVLIIIKLLGKRLGFKEVKFPIKWLAAALVIPALIGLLYYSKAGDGVVLVSLKSSIPFLNTNTVLNSSTTTIVQLSPTGSYFERQEPLIRTALGLDFGEASIIGKGFRLCQFGIEIALLVGCIWLVISRKKVSSEYIAFAFSSVVILGACILLPRFSNIINATRFYHIALFTLSPIIIVGASKTLKLIRKAYTPILIVFLVTYILYSTGAVFELTKQTDISKVTIPYSIALSNYRIWAVGEYTSNDSLVASWIHTNSIQPILTDIDGMLLLSQEEYPFAYIRRNPITSLYDTDMPPGPGAPGVAIEDLKKGWGYLPQNVNDLPEGSYIFLTERSVKTQTVIFKPNWFYMKDTASGMRTAYSFSYLNLDLEDYIVIYRQGDAVVLQAK